MVRGRPARPARPLSLATAAREYIWLYDLRQGVSIAEIARGEGLSRRRIKDGICRARAADCRPAPAIAPEAAPPPRAVPLFPIGAFTPGSTCPHRGAVPYPFSCMVCSAAWHDAP